MKGAGSDRETGRVRPPAGTAGGIEYYEHLLLATVVGRRIRMLRGERGWRQLDVARRLALAGYPWGQGAVAAVESGDRQLGQEETVAFARVFGVPIDQLLPAGRGDESLPVVRIGRDGLPLAALRWYLSGGHAGRRDADPVRGQVDRPDFNVEYADLLLEYEETTRNAAIRLQVDRETVIRAAVELWGMSLPRRRDAELDDQLRDEGRPEVTARSRQALRGHITRRLLAEMRAALAKESQ